MFKGFHTAIVAIDDSAESLAALDETLRLVGADAVLTAVTVCQHYLAVHTGFNAPRVSAEIHEAALAAQARAAASLDRLPNGDTQLLHGRPTSCLLKVAKEIGADLIAVGSHERSRAEAIVLGSVASEILHRAHESVLVARPGDGPELGRIVVGVDGSPTSIGAYAIAHELAKREGAELVAVAATGGKGVNTLILDEFPG